MRHRASGRRLTAGVLPILLLLAPPATSALLAVRSASAQTVIVRAARMFDPEAGTVAGPVTVVVDGDRIREVNPAAAPQGVEVVDLGDVTLTRDVREIAADAALRGARNARSTLLAGFTTVRDLGALGFADVSLRKAIDRGFVDGPRVTSSVSTTGDGSRPDSSRT